MRLFSQHIIGILAVTMFTAFSTPAVAIESASSFEETTIANIEDFQNAIKIEVKEGSLYITNAEGMTMEIYSITGEKVHTQKIDSQSKVISLSGFSNRCYIVRIGKIARKIYIK